MENWKIITILVGVVYGLYNIFAKSAAGRISDILGANVMEIVAAVLLLIGLIWLQGNDTNAMHYTKKGILFSVLAGLSIAVLSVLYLMTFRLGAPLSIAGPAIMIVGGIVMVVVGFTIFKEPLSVRLILGLILGFSSIYLLIGTS